MLSNSSVELKSLKNHGEVLFVDGTNILNRNVLQVFPMPVLDEKLLIKSAGTFFADRAHKEVLEFFLLSLFSCEEASIIETIITDEELVLVSAKNELHRVKHVL